MRSCRETYAFGTRRTPSVLVSTPTPPNPTQSNFPSRLPSWEGFFTPFSSLWGLKIKKNKKHLKRRTPYVRNCCGYREEHRWPLGMAPLAPTPIPSSRRRGTPARTKNLDNKEGKKIIKTRKRMRTPLVRYHREEHCCGSLGVAPLAPTRLPSSETNLREPNHKWK